MSVMRSLVGTVERVEWDPAAASAGDEVAEARLDEARRRFERHRAVNGEVLERQPNGAFKRVTEFPEDADELILVPPVAGG